MMLVEIKKLEIHELDSLMALMAVFKDTFEMQDTKHFSHDRLNKLLQSSYFHAWVVFLDEEVLGGLTAYTLEQYYTSSSQLYIYDVAVKSAYQRQGIGKKLITVVKDFCKTEGIQEIFVQADQEDSHALEFYRSTGANAKAVVHFDYFLK